ncbi:MAG: protoporphyrinogen oxidase [Terracidiphilus sp.]
MRTAIIGGGIAGMAAAFELEKARAAGEDAAYTLFEARERLGGVLDSETVGGAVLERGPDSFLTEKPAAAELCRELGLANALTSSNDQERKTWIVARNRLVPLPDGLMFLIPTKLVPTALTRLFSVGTKMRMARELLLPPRTAHGDESVAALVERHYGREAVERLADPLLSGIYGGDATQLSVRTVLPRLVEMEEIYGSLTRGMLAAHRQMRRRAAERAREVGAAGNRRQAPRGVFTTLRGGMRQLVEGLEARLNPDSIRRGSPVSALRRIGEGWLVTSAGTTEEFDAIILASPAWASGALLGGVDAALGEELTAIPYSSSITVNLVFDQSVLGPLPKGFGFLVPASEGRAMLACTFAHRKFPGRAPKGKAVLRVFLGGARNETLLSATDESLLATVRRELGEILGAAVMRQGAEPEAVRVARWPRAMAQYAVGHQERLARIHARLEALPGLRLAGNAYDGIGISDCIRLGRGAARELMEQTVKA